MSTAEPDPYASFKAANRERTDAWNAEPDHPEEEPLMATFRVKLPAMTMVQRWRLAEFLDETATRTCSAPGTGWESAMIGVLRDLATAAREAKGKAVASAAEANDVGSEVTLSAGVPINREARILLHEVLKVATQRAGDCGVAVRVIQSEFEVFVFGPDGEPDEDPRMRRRRDSRPGMWQSSDLFRS